MSVGRIPLVAQWSLGQLLFSSRTLGMGAVASTPAFVAVGYRIGLWLGLAERTSGFHVFTVLTASVAFPFVAPMLSLFYASGVVSDDVEAGTLRYFLTRPLPRAHWLAGKMVGTYAMSLLLFVPPYVVCYYLSVAPSGWNELGVRFPTLMVDLGAAALGLFAYNGLFAFIGTVLRRPLLTGLFFVFGWQAAAAVVPGAARYFTVTHYLNSLVPHGTLTGSLAALFGQRSSALEAVLALVVIGVAAHAAAIRAFRSKEP